MCISKETLKLYWKTFILAIVLTIIVNYIVGMVGTLFAEEAIGIFALLSPLYVGLLLPLIGGIFSFLYLVIFWPTFLLLNILFFSIIYKRLSSRQFFRRYLGASIINFFSMAISSLIVLILMQVLDKFVLHYWWY